MTSQGPCVVTRADAAAEPWGWIEKERGKLEALLLRDGALLLHGLGLGGAEDLARLVRAFGGEPLGYGERSSPRRAVGDNVYTSTEYPASQSIVLHNENSYQQRWPARLFFFSRRVARRGGETPLADTRRVLGRIDPAVGRRFARHGVRYVRNYSRLFGLRWSEVFQTEERGEVEAYCRRARIGWEWKADGGLRTVQVRPAVARHPQSGELSWFNHAAFFHASALPAAFREGLEAMDVPEDDYPSQTYYGDGATIEPEAMDALRRAYQEETVQFRWQTGDVLVVDNVAVAHGRRPFEGEREVLVAMSGLTDWADAAAGVEDVYP